MRGGWVRKGIAIDGGPMSEPATVWWLQAASKHCDLRVPHDGLDGLVSFAGTTSWAEPRLTWQPELEFDPSVFEDVGVITWDGSDLIETGSIGDGAREIGYVERWQRLPGSETEHLALSNETGRIVRTGRYALAITDGRAESGEFSAVAWSLHDDQWTAEFAWPPDWAAPRPPYDIPAEGDMVVLDDGSEWTIDER